MPGLTDFAAMLREREQATQLGGDARRDLQEPRFGRFEPAPRLLGAAPRSSLGLSKQNSRVVTHIQQLNEVSIHPGSENVAPPPGRCFNGRRFPSPTLQQQGLSSRDGQMKPSSHGHQSGPGGSGVLSILTEKHSSASMPLRDITNLSRGAAATAVGPKRLKPSLPSKTVSSTGPSHTADLRSREPASHITAAHAPTAQVDRLLPLQKDLEPFCVDHKEDVQHVTEYAPNIFEALFAGEEREAIAVRPDYMELQPEVNGKMRSILVDWLVEVHVKYRLRPETLYLAVNLLDRYMSKASVTRKRLQLNGVVALFIAAKFEEVEPPTIQQFVYITDNAYTREDILTLECSMLIALQFEVVVPTAWHFLERLLRANNSDARYQSLARYILELSLPDLRSLCYKQSTLAAAALLLSNELAGRSPAWPPVVERCARHSEASLRGCVEELRSMLEAAPSCYLQAVKKKYDLPQHHKVASMAVNLAAVARSVGGA